MAVIGITIASQGEPLLDARRIRESGGAPLVLRLFDGLVQAAQAMEQSLGPRTARRS